MKNRLVTLLLVCCSLLCSLLRYPANAEPISVSVSYSSVYTDVPTLEEQRQGIESAIEELDRRFCFPKASSPLIIRPGLFPESLGGLYSEKEAAMYVNLLGHGEEAPFIITVHEVYHHLSLKAFLPAQKKALEDALMPEIMKTQRVRDIRIFSNLFPDDVSVKFTADYLLSKEELMARAFVQHFVETVKNPTASKEFNNTFQGRWGWGHWEEKDFQPVGEIMGKKLKEFGWLQ